MQNKWMKFPIKWGIIYSIFIIVMYLFGVWTYPNTNRFILILLLILYNAAMYYGFVYGTKKVVRLKLGVKNQISNSFKEDASIMVWKFYKLCFWVAVVFLVPRFIIYTGLYEGLSLSTILSKIQFSVSDVNQAYMYSHTAGNSVIGVWRLVNLFSVLTSGFSWCYTPMVIILWKKLRKSHRVFAIFYWVVYCVQFVITATNSGIIGQIFYLAVSLAFVTAYRKHKANREGVKNVSGKLKTLLVAVLIVLIIIGIFGFAMSSRVGTDYSAKYIGKTNITYNDNSIFNVLTPKSFHPTLAVADHYLTQGYCALEMSISLPWSPTFFLGNSRFVMSNFYELTGINMFNETYQMRLYETQGWHYDIQWHTAYLWLANDFTLYLLPVFLFVLFLYFGSCWRLFLQENNVFGLLAVVLYAQFMFYISANNNLFSLYDTLIAFILVVYLIIKSRDYNWEHFVI